jgi:putative transcriptional regulator
MPPDWNRNDVRNDVRAVRARRGLTQQDLAEAIGLTRQSIIAIEKGRFVPSVHTALLLARALDMPVGDLFWLAREDGI